MEVMRVEQTELLLGMLYWEQKLEDQWDIQLVTLLVQLLGFLMG